MKHVGRQIANKRKCVIAYRVVPKDAEYCLVVFTDTLEAADHDTLMNTVESNAGQNAYEFAEVMARTSLSDGRNMLYHFSNTGKLVKMLTKDIELTPNTTSAVSLSEVNEAVAQQKGVTVEDLALQPSEAQQAQEQEAPVVEEAVTTEQPITEGVITDEELAAQYRSQADSLFKEAKRLREQAEELVPTKKKAKAKTAESA